MPNGNMHQDVDMQQPLFPDGEAVPLDEINKHRKKKTSDNKPCQDPIIEAVVKDIRTRSEVGQKKYGVGLDRTDLNFRDWLQHAYEESLDHSNYLKKVITEYDNAIRKFPEATEAEIIALITVRIQST